MSIFSICYLESEIDNINIKGLKYIYIKYNKIVIKIINFREDESLDNELFTFISSDVWKEILRLHLNATDLVTLKNDLGMLKKLGIFICKAVKAVIIAIDNRQDT